MPARTGRDYIEALNASRRDVLIHGERVTARVADHPAFRNLVRSYAALYDLQHEPELREVMTYPSPTTGERVGVQFLTPRTREDLERRRAMMKVWADYSCGMLGRTADYLNSAIMAMAAAADWFAQADPAFGENIRKYYEYIRENDLLLTHTLIHPQANRAAGPAGQKDPYLAARIVKHTDRGIVIRGARMLATLGPLTDEIMVFPSTLLKATPEDEPYSYAFAIPCDTPGLRFICRESFDYGRSGFDHPLGSRFDEIDAIVVFDDVLVPYERCFMIGHPELCNALYSETSATVFMTHQVMVKNLAKTEFILGLVSLLTDAIQIERFQHVQEKVAEIIIAREILAGLLRAAEVDARPNRWGIMAPKWEPLNAGRNWFPRVYQRFVEIIRQLGASGLMALPTEGDVFGPGRADVERYLQAAALDGIERVRLFRLAWDTAMSAFGSRQALYEYFFFGDPVRMAGALVNSYDRQPYMDHVRQFLARCAEEVDRMGAGTLPADAGAEVGTRPAAGA
ncbi:MAG: 4-hydroxyphenylacetate 3-monooxygenase, oxygenase component [Bacillota bacterium]|nr:MAG: 4-hydroxyphenylacetate 3-monooxygenase, oxygenase component [Bacillota bacterium]